MEDVAFSDKSHFPMSDSGTGSKHLYLPGEDFGLRRRRAALWISTTVLCISFVEEILTEAIMTWSTAGTSCGGLQATRPSEADLIRLAYLLPDFCEAILSTGS